MTKRSEEIGIQIKENEKEYEKALEESRRIAEINNKKYYHEVEKAKNDNNKSNKAIIQHLGKILARGLLKHDQSKISAKLKRDLKGVIHRSSIYEHADPSWRNQSYNRNTTGKNRSPLSKSSTEIRSDTTEPLSEQDKKYVEAFEREYARNQKIADILYEWTNKTLAEQGDIIRRTPVGTHWSKLLIEESKGHMLMLAKQMIPSDISPTLTDLRVLRNVADAFSDVLYEQQELNKKNEGLHSA